MSGQKWVYGITAQGLQGVERAHLVLSNEPGVADHVGAQDRGQAALDLRCDQRDSP